MTASNKESSHDFPSDIHRRVPVNKQTSLLMTPLPQIVSNKKPSCIHSDTPITVSTCPRSTENLTGVKFGRFRVIGYFRTKKISNGSEKKRANKHIWVVRCVCGVYTVRSNKAIRNSKNGNDMCDRCRQTEYLKRQR